MMIHINKTAVFVKKKRQTTIKTKNTECEQKTIACDEKQNTRGHAAGHEELVITQTSKTRFWEGGKSPHGYVVGHEELAITKKCFIKGKY